jgi:N-acetylmuramic acid 6-phosphate etherase
MPTSDYHSDHSDYAFNRLVTEQANDASIAIDRMSPLQIVQTMNAEDATIAVAVQRELPAIAQAVEAIADRLRLGGRLISIGAGTSGRLGALDAAECPPTFDVSPDRIIGVIAGGSFALVQSAEDLEDSAAAGSADIERLEVSTADALVGITASGRTPYVLGAVASARARGTLVIGLTCNTDTPLHRVADIVIAPDVGPEVIAGSTRLKAGTAQKMVLNMLSTASMVLLGKTYGNLMVDVRATNAKLHGRALTILAQATGLSRDDCEKRLVAANGELKTAILATRANLTPEVARKQLARHGGVLRAALEDVP